jgi:hypothetical protein
MKSPHRHRIVLFPRVSLAPPDVRPLLFLLTGDAVGNSQGWNDESESGHFESLL